jgi:hypothetical protein
VQNLVQEAGTPKVSHNVLSRSFGWLARAIWTLCLVLITAWCTLAIYYSNLPWAGLRLALAVCFAVVAIWPWPIVRGRNENLPHDDAQTQAR